MTPPLLLGLVQSPDAEAIIYAGLAGANEVGRLHVRCGSGDLSLVGYGRRCRSGRQVRMLDDRSSANGKFLYTVDTGTNSVGVFSLADPAAPRLRSRNSCWAGRRIRVAAPTAAR